MIRLSRAAPPAMLTPEFVATGTAQFNLDGSSVWNVEEIKTTLSGMSGGKCAYCELRLGEGAAYVEVEHFHPKNHHPHRVLDWNNLLPACKRCNGKKSDWDVAVPGQMMVDPVSMDPSAHIRLDTAYRPVGLTPEGENSIVEISLDDIPRLGVMRYKLGETFKRKIEDLHTSYGALGPTASTRQRRSVIRKIKQALEKCSRDQPFSAVAATVLMRSHHYGLLKADMIAAGEWDAELNAYDAIAVSSSLA